MNEEKKNNWLPFRHVRYGYRAAFVLLNVYITRHGCHTPRQVERRGGGVADAMRQGGLFDY